jgi:hypothetical protein
MAGSITVPILADDGALLGTLGIAKPEAYEFGDAETARLLAAARSLATLL